MKKRWKRLIACLSILAISSAVQASDDNLPQNIVTLSTEVSESVEQDTATIRLYTEQENRNPATLAKEITKTLNQALEEAKTRAPSVKAWSGGYQTWPVNNKNNVITRWRARAEIVLESQDFSAIAALAGKLSQQMQIGNMEFSLSRQKRNSVEQTLTHAAIQAFRRKAQDITRQFGFQHYNLVDINFNINTPMPRRTNSVMFAMADTESAALQKSVPLPIEGGESEVTLRISGKIQMLNSRDQISNARK